MNNETLKANLAIIVKAMCDHGFMNGWFGDVSDEFQAEQVDYLAAMTAEERSRWIDRNRFNLTNYCGLVPLPTV